MLKSKLKDYLFLFKSRITVFLSLSSLKKINLEIIKNASA